MRGFQIPLSGRVRLEQLALAPQLALGGLQIGLGLAHVRRRHAHVWRFQRHQRRAFPHALPELRLDVADPTGHRREDVGHVRVVESDAAWGGQLGGDRLFFHCRHRDLAGLHLLRR